MQRACALIACVVLCLSSLTARGGTLNVQIEEIAAGLNGDGEAQFIEIRLLGPGDTLWGPQGAEIEGRVRLVFFDATGTQTEELVFDADAPLGSLDPTYNNYSVLIATEAFADLPGMPAPDFTFPRSILAVDGKVCFTSNPDNPSAPSVNLCLSYGNFIGDTEGAGPPTASIPITDANAMQRIQNYSTYASQSNADFAMSSSPAPRNSAGDTATVVPIALEAQGETVFRKETFYGNGRTCFTCHRDPEGFGLNASSIAQLAANEALFIAESDPNLSALENPCLMRGARGLILENIDGFTNPPVFRGSPHLFNVAETAPYGQSGEFPDLQTFCMGAVQQHFPKTTVRNSNPSAGPLDVRLPTQRELEAMEAFMLAIRLPADGNYDIDDMVNAAISRGADAAAIQRGRDLFFGVTGSAKCFTCHSGPVMDEVDAALVLSDMNTRRPFNTGLADLFVNDTFSDACIGGPLAVVAPEDGGNRLFDVRSLLGVSITAPYFHDGSAPSLREAVAFYTSVEFNNSPASMPPPMGSGPISMSSQDIDDITAFLETLVEPFVDCDNSTIDDRVEIASGSPDCNNNKILDDCELAENDCNANLIPDICDLSPLQFGDAAGLGLLHGAFSIGAADVDNDDDDDLLIPGWIVAMPGELEVLINDGAGNFIAHSSTFEVGEFPRSLATADIDEDGYLDVIMPSFTTDNVSVLMNNGTDQGQWLGFAPVMFIPMNGPDAWTYSITVGDWDGDGDTDFAAAMRLLDKVAVVKNNGNDGMGVWQGFAPPVDYGIGAGDDNWYVTWGHMNADNAPDLLTSNVMSDNISILFNDGSGAFPTVTNEPVGDSPQSLAVADLDGDLIHDVAVPNFGNDTVSIQLNDGLGNLTDVGTVVVGAYPFGASPQQIRAIDIDQDGDADLLTSNKESNNVSISINEGNAEFIKLINLPVFEDPEGLTVGDFNGDGAPDVAAIHFNPANLAVMLNQTPPYGGDCNQNGVPDTCDLSSASSADVNANNVPDECEGLGDIDNDGDVDFVDMSLFVSVLLGLDETPLFVARSDVDASGAPDGRDIALYTVVFLAGT